VPSARGTVGAVTAYLPAERLKWRVTSQEWRRTVPVSKPQTVPHMPNRVASERTWGRLAEGQD
jgi:hypothetical protein